MYLCFCRASVGPSLMLDKNMQICCEFAVGTLLAGLAVLQRMFCTVVQLLVSGVNNLIHNSSKAWPPLCLIRHSFLTRRVKVAPGTMCDILCCYHNAHTDDDLCLSFFTLQFYFLYIGAKTIDIQFRLRYYNSHSNGLKKMLDLLLFFFYVFRSNSFDTRISRLPLILDARSCPFLCTPVVRTFWQSRAPWLPTCRHHSSRAHSTPGQDIPDVSQPYPRRDQDTQDHCHHHCGVLVKITV